MESPSTLYWRGNLVFRKIENFYVVLCPEVPNITVVDELGKEILEQCNNNYTINKIIEFVYSKYGSAKSTKDEMKNFISSMLKAGFLDVKPFSISKRETPQLDKLVALQLHLTRRCNQRCKHCYIDAGPPLENEMSDNQFLNVIKEFANLGGDTLMISGGEPFLRYRLLHNAVKTAKQYGIKVSIETNGTLVTNDAVELCSKYSVRVGVSLDGATPQSYSYIRGEGGFEKAVESIKTLVEANVYTTIGMTLMKTNINEAEELVYLAKKLRAPRVFFNMMRIMGRAKENLELAVPLETVISTLKRAYTIAKELGIETRFEEASMEQTSLSKIDSCGAGDTLLCIAPNGDVYPCNILQEEPFKAGNIRERSLREIWEKSTALQKLRSFNVLDIPECSKCELKFICGGGCPAETFHAYGSLKKHSPWCSLYKEAYWNEITRLGHKLWKEA